ncbi:MAG: hypothetical protein H0V54_16425 [Chthoniobacterales bacterium]|nr:hypothetical protein [Chthoniobacterales bacterium]
MPIDEGSHLNTLLFDQQPRSYLIPVCQHQRAAAGNSAIAPRAQMSTSRSNFGGGALPGKADYDSLREVVGTRRAVTASAQAVALRFDRDLFDTKANTPGGYGMPRFVERKDPKGVYYVVQITL